MDANRRANVWATGFILVVVLVLVSFGVCSCGGLRKTMLVAAGGAGGAAVGTLAGPGGTIGGAALGAGATQAIVENGELRSGELVGEDALRAENARLAKLVNELGAERETFARKATELAGEGLWSWAKRWTLRLLGLGALAWIAWNGSKLVLTQRGREARKKLGWLRGLLAADGIKHTR